MKPSNRENEAEELLQEAAMEFNTLYYQLSAVNGVDLSTYAKWCSRMNTKIHRHQRKWAKRKGK